jgi:hypothetical protein
MQPSISSQENKKVAFGKAAAPNVSRSIFTPLSHDPDSYPVPA